MFTLASIAAASLLAAGSTTPPFVFATVIVTSFGVQTVRLIGDATSRP